jgi:hypothetical protein
VLKLMALSRVRGVLGAALVACVLLLGSALADPGMARAEAGVVCTTDITGKRVCTGTVTEDETPGGAVGEVVGGLTPAPDVCLDRQADNSDREISCQSDIGWWSNSMQCYLRLTEPQRPAPAGLSPEGAWYDCNPPPAVTCDPGTVCRDEWSTTNWLLTPPPGVTTLTPGQAARSLVDSFELEGITVGFAPDPNLPGSRSYVGVPVWMWAENPTPLTFGPYVQTTTLGGVSLTATAQVTSIIWNMGDGTTVTCANAGTPFVAAYGAVDSPNCGHRYERTSASQPGGTFPVTATSQWQVSWEGGGASGVIPITTTSATAVQINEIQSVNVGAGG